MRGQRRKDDWQRRLAQFWLGRALDSASGRVPVAVVKPATAERN